MNVAIFNILFATMTITLIVSFGNVNGQGGCADIVCDGGPTDRCMECGSACPPTCQNPRQTGACIQVCRTNTCQCTGGTVRGPDGQCINPQDCPR